LKVHKMEQLDEGAERLNIKKAKLEF